MSKPKPIAIVQNLVNMVTLTILIKSFISSRQVSQFEKREKLLEVVTHIYETEDESCKSLVFVEMKKTADFIASYMYQSGFPTTSIHGDR